MLAWNEERKRKYLEVLLNFSELSIFGLDNFIASIISESPVLTGKRRKTEDNKS